MPVIYYFGPDTLTAIDTAPVVVPPPPPPSPPVGDLAWFTSKASRTITNLGATVLQSMNPWPQITPNAPSGANADSIGGFKSILAASGMVFCSWRGKAGSLVLFGGGHNDYCGNDMYECDLYSNSYTQLKAPNWPLFKDAAGYHANGTDGEHYADATATTTLQDQPSTGHNYGQPLALPPDATFAEGAILMPCIPSLTPGGQKGGTRAHVFDLASRKWSRFSTNTIASIGYSGSCLDKKRGLAIVPMYNGLATLNLATRAFSTLCSLPSGTPYMIWTHHEASDLYVAVWRYSTSQEVWIVNPTTKVLTRKTVTWPNNTYAGGAVWSKLLNGFAYYHGQGESEVLLVQPTTGDPMGAWSITKLPFTGDIPAKDTLSGAGAHCKRFLEHEAAGGFLWLANTTTPVQFFKA